MIGGPGLQTGARGDALVEFVDVLPTLLLEPIGYPLYRNKVLHQYEDPDSVGRAIPWKHDPRKDPAVQANPLLAEG